MSKHLVAFYQTAGTGTAFVNMPPISDPTINQDLTGNTIQVPTANQVAGVYGYGVNLTRLQVTSPSLKADSVPMEIEGLDNTATHVISTSPPPFHYFGDTPVPLKAGENAAVQYVTDGTGTYTIAGLWLTSGSHDIVTGKLIRGVRATGSTTVTAGAWSNCALTFDNSLPVGSYSVVGMQVGGATAVLARVVIPGYPWRMGVVSSGIVNATSGALNNPGVPFFRDGRFGRVPGFTSGIYESWGTFVSTAPPSVEFLCTSADTAQTVVLDLVKVA